jgi:hypothetical protein
MANFQDNRFFGFSLRTAGISVVVLAITVGLFFIPEFIKGQISRGSSRGRSAADATPHKVDKEREQQEKAKQLAQQQLQFSEDNVPAARESAANKGGAAVERASLSRDKIGAFTDIDALMKEPVRGGGVIKPTPKAAPQQEAAPAKEGGFFSGLIKSRKSSRKSEGAPTGVSIENLTSKDAQNFFKKGQADIARFSKSAKTLTPPAVDALQKVSESYDAVVRGGGKTADSQDLAAELQRVHRSTLNTLVKTRSDRGKIIEWLSLPSVAFVEESLGGRSLAAIRGFFAPSMVVRNLSVRQRGGNIPALGSSGPVVVSAEVAIKGTDVDKVALLIGGQRQREIKPGNPDADGYRTFKIRGSGDGLWSLVAFDKYGARPFTKNYAFNSRVRWFRRDPRGEYMIAFRPGSARNSLDRFFYVGGTRVTNGSRDPSISVF